MSKKVAVIAVNPVNGFGLFHYLESFFENGIAYKVYAVDKTKNIKTNSGVALTLDGVVHDLRGKESEFDALVFACGDAIPKFEEVAGESYVADMMAIINKFNADGKLLIGHCAAASMFENAGITEGRKVSIHPYGKSLIKRGFPNDDAYTMDGNIYTAQCENTLNKLMPHILEALK